jgi:hypothetical protein
MVDIGGTGDECQQSVNRRDLRRAGRYRSAVRHTCGREASGFHSCLIFLVAEIKRCLRIR